MSATAGGTQHPRWTASRPTVARAICRTFFAAILAILVPVTPPAFAAGIEVPADELPRLKACEEKFCSMVLKKEPVGDDLKCKLSKTWAQETLKGGETKAVRWGFGDAHCALNFSLARSEVISALTKPEYTVQIPSQTVKCEVDRDGELKPVVAKLAPKIMFKNGHAEKVWINLTEMDGPADIKGTVWTAAQLEDSLGIFHRGMIKSINKFLYKRCNDQYGPGAMAKALKKLNADKRRAAARAAKAAATGAAPEAAKSTEAPKSTEVPKATVAAPEASAPASQPAAPKPAAKTEPPAAAKPAKPAATVAPAEKLSTTAPAKPISKAEPAAPAAAPAP